MSNPQFPLYIPSKGRADTRLTMRALDELGVPYKVVVEDQQVDTYAAALGAHRVLALPRRYQEEYDTFDTLGLSKSVGPGAARNFIWDHSIEHGYPWHWVMDDNILCFKLRTKMGRVLAVDGTMFKLMEDFVLRYRNVGMAGPNYHMFLPDGQYRPPFLTNTRIYSCNLIRNDLPFRWRGRYNEDTDLSLRMLKAGWCTIQFNAFLQHKITTQLMKGGNTDAFYAKEGTTRKSTMLYAMHPDVTKVTMKYGRVHHYIDYKPFQKLRLLPKPGLPAPTGKPTMRLVDLGSGVTGRRSHEFWQQSGVAK